jgi:hypothetical protein
MGMEQTVVFAGGTGPSWPAIQDLLTRRGFPVQLRMINGELAFPDEKPPEPWLELRLSTPLGMVTLRREPNQVKVVTWGNADAALRQAWNAITWGVAEAASGHILSPHGPQAPADFQREAELPPELRP